jgi:hypothetical protein
MSQQEVVRLAIAGVVCVLVLFVLGFGPLLIPQDGVWAASIKSSAAMPIGESKQADTMAPFEIKRPDYGSLEFVRKHFGR